MINTERFLGYDKDGHGNLIINEEEAEIVSRIFMESLQGKGAFTIARNLKDLGIGVIFEKENINTLDAKGEVLLSNLSSLAQDERRSISENSTWGIRRQFEQGKVALNPTKFIDYGKDDDGSLIINEPLAKVVRRIFIEYLDGKGPNRIARGKKLRRKAWFL